MELQPEASLILMHTRTETAKLVSHPDNRVVCKWDDGEVKTRIRKLASVIRGGNIRWREAK